MNTSWAETMRQVEERAGGRCEYCRMHQALQGATFHVEHVRPRAEGGSDDLDNLAWACPGCNLKKSDRQTILDPDTGALIPLFHPRVHIWSEHFSWSSYILVGLTTVGRTLIAAFDLNSERRQLIRRAEEQFGLFPPPNGK